jgi:hypothetical protein
MTIREVTGKTRGQNGVASPFLWGSFNSYNVPVYPGALCHRLLLLGDFAGFRDAICSMLSNRPDLLVVAEASDGLEAVRKAEATRLDCARPL